MGPLVATAIASSQPDKWSFYYFFTLGLAVLNLGLVSWAFRDDVRVSRLPREDGEVQGHGRLKQALEEFRAIMKEKTFWLLSLFYFFHLGAGLTMGGALLPILLTSSER